MIDLAFELDPKTGNYKMSLKNGDLKWVSGKYAVQNRIDAQLSMIKGEWAWDTSMGLILLDPVFRRRQFINIALGLIRKLIQNVKGVSEVVKLEFDGFEEGRSKISYIVRIGEETISGGF